MSPRLLAYLVLAASPFFLSSNLIIGAIAVRSTEPFTLTFLRWSLAFLLILPFAWRSIRRHRSLLLKQWRLILLCAFLAMGLCGTGVYWALKNTTATNGTLIYTASPVLIIVMEGLFRGRLATLREIAGIALGISGILFIVFRGSIEVMLSVQFNSGDILFVIAATAWAIYSVLLKKRVFQPVPTVAMFATVAFFGALIQVPFMLWELSGDGAFPNQMEQWLSLFGLALISSVLAFTSYQFGIKVLGPATAGIFMYFLPPIGVLLAVIFLGERFLPFHMVGLVLVTSGVVLATFPRNLLAKSDGERG